MVDIGLDLFFPGNVAPFCTLVMADHRDAPVCQNLSQPGGELGFGGAAELRKVSGRLQAGLLSEIRRVGLGL